MLQIPLQTGAIIVTKGEDFTSHPTKQV
jgi:hypothetical protein